MLIVRNLKCFYGQIMAIKGISLSVEKGELITLIGANGAGKSTLLQAICGLLNNWQGEILFESLSLKNFDPPMIVKMGISMVPEGRLIFSSLSVMDNLKLGAYTLYRKKQIQQVKFNIDMVLELFPILKDRASQLGGTLSGGEQQMLAIGRALMASPRFLVLDEPSMGLAPIIVEKILETLVFLKNQGLTMLLIEQNAQAALKISDRAYVLETGQIVLQGKACDLLLDNDVKRAYLGKDYDKFHEKF